MSYFYLSTFDKPSDLYSFLNSVSSPLEVIESGQLHRGHLTLLLQSSIALSKPKSCVDFFETQKDISVILAAYYKQRHLDASHGLLLLESQNLSALFSFLTMTDIVSLNHLLEISRSAIPNGLAQAIFVNIDSIDLQKLPSEIRGTYFQKLSAPLLSLFTN